MEMTIGAIFISLAIFLGLSIPIGIAIGLSVLVGMFIGEQQLQSAFLMQKMISSLDLFPLMAVPFFILAGEIMQKGEMAQRLLAVSRCLVGHITGGMAHISILTCMFYGALSGSSPATVAAVGGVMIPSMEKEGYDKPFSTAVNTAAGCLGVMIPPSVPLIIYGTVAGVSVGDLFMAGVIPGVFVGLCLMLTSYIIAKRKGYAAGNRASLKELFHSLNEAKYALFVPVIVLGGIYGGLTTPTEAGVIAVIYALLAEGLIHKSLNWDKGYEIIRGTVLTNSSIFLVVATATAFGQILMFYNVPDLMVSTLTEFSTNKYVFITIIIVLLLIMGTFMDALANILILTPLLLPVVQKFDFNLVHFGIIMIVTVSIGFLTPPVGVNLFVGCGISKLRIETLSYAVLPFVFAMSLAALVLAFIPQISLWLPTLMTK